MADDSLIGTRITDAGGAYNFDDANLQPGNYTLVEIQPGNLPDGTSLLDGRETAGGLGGNVDNTMMTRSATLW